MYKRDILEPVHAMIRKDLQQMTADDALDCIGHQWPQLTIFPEEGEDGSGECVFGSKEEALEYARASLKKFKAMSDPIPVWRVVAARSKEDVDLDRGSSWSFTKKAALDFASDNGSNYIVSGKAPKSFVDWCATIGLSVMNSDLMGVENEDEIRVNAKYVDDKEVNDIGAIRESRSSESPKNANLMINNLAAIVEDGWKRVVQKVSRALGYRASGFAKGERAQLVSTEDLPGYKSVLKKMDGTKHPYIFIANGALDDQIVLCRIEFVEPNSDIVEPLSGASFIPWKTSLDGKDYVLDIFTLTVDPRAYWHDVLRDVRSNGSRFARHEARHSVEKRLSGKTQGSSFGKSTLQRYYDNPGEVRARASEVDSDVEKLARKNPRLDFKTILGMSEGWRRIIGAEESGIDMTKTKRYVLKVAAKAYQKGREEKRRTKIECFVTEAARDVAQADMSLNMSKYERI